MLVSIIGLPRGMLVWTKDLDGQPPLVLRVQQRAGGYWGSNDFEKNDAKFNNGLRPKLFFSYLFKQIQLSCM